MYNNMIFPSLISQKHFFKFIIYLNSFKYIKYILKKKTYMSSFKPLYSNTKNGNMVNMFEMHAIDGLN